MFCPWIFLRTSHCELFIFRSAACSSSYRFFSCSSTSLSSNFPPVSRVLSEESKFDCIKRLQAFKIISPRRAPPETMKKAAVLVPLCVVNNELSFLYTLRKSDLKRHRGQVSFPGGVQDPTDKSLIETALRETEEELGIPRDSVDVWGVGSFILGVEFTVLPVIGNLGEINLEDLTPNPDEVEYPFFISLKHFCDPVNCRYTQFRIGPSKGYTLPTYINAECRVWGITALITHLVLTSLLPQNYKHTIKYIKPLVLRDPVL